MFISFEGVEGAGKSTQIALLAERLRREGDREVCVTREPGDTALGRELRRLALNSASEFTLDDRAELFLMLADRAQHVVQVIVPHLTAEHVVICDRYTDSTVAYQGHGRGLDLSVIQTANAFATGDLEPDITILLDLDPRLGLARQTERNRMEDETLPFHRRVRNGFLALAGEYPLRFAVIDAARPVDVVHEQVWAVIRKDRGGV